MAPFCRQVVPPLEESSGVMEEEDEIIGVIEEPTESEMEKMHKEMTALRLENERLVEEIISFRIENEIIVMMEEPTENEMEKMHKEMMHLSSEGHYLVLELSNFPL